MPGNYTPARCQRRPQKMREVHDFTTTSQSREGGHPLTRYSRLCYRTARRILRRIVSVMHRTCLGGDGDGAPSVLTDKLRELQPGRDVRLLITPRSICVTTQKFQSDLQREVRASETNRPGNPTLVPSLGKYKILSARLVVWGEFSWSDVQPWHLPTYSTNTS
jgi:hypothetical protein